MFKHGHQFDHQQNRYVNEMLCRLMSDEVAQVQDGVWGKYNALKFHLTSWLMLGPRLTRISELKATPELRLSNERLREIESTAFAEVRGKWNTILVFGHTHSPFINELRNLANAGSWVTEAENAYFNTYVELFEGQARLYHYGKEEIRVRKTVR
jgi:predicted phosphodiesterase